MKRLITFLATALIVVSAVAQSANDKFTVTRTNGNTTEYKLSEYDRITYSGNKQYIHKVGQTSKIGVDISNIQSVKFDISHASDVSDVQLADNAANDDAKRLYKYLKLNYGVNIISSIMANVNWNNDEATKIYQATGKYPAMNCYDFIHMPYSGQNWINYDDITPVTNWVDAGGLVSLMWHFNVPKTQGSTDVTCTPSETTFKASNALVSGTWENAWYVDQVNKVANVILKLQDAGIAAVWRPYHEAAGNATLKSGADWGRSWFWWGYDGAEVYKQLWVDMFDRFREKGIHNLIWVWTTQNYNGNSSQYNVDTDWYPGDNYVDIVGRDLYGYTAAQNEQEFREISARYPDKLVTLAECGVDVNGGNIPFSEVADLWEAGARWSWFMPWYGGSMPSNSWWSNAFSKSYVITRDKVNINATYVEESAASAVKNMKLGWNLGNTLDASNTWTANPTPADFETAWGQPVTTQALMTFLKKEGFNAVRVPVTWWQHLDGDNNINEDWMNRVQEVVDYVINAGMYCILNVHHDTGAGDTEWLKADIDTYEANNAKFVKIWQQIAARFATYDQHLLFEGYNEMLDKNNTWSAPKNTSSYTALNQFAQSFVNTVRATGGNNATRNLIVNTYSAAHGQATLDNFTVPTDNASGHIIAQIHSYDPYDWFAGGSWTASCSTEIANMFTRLNNKFVSQGIPVIIGEYGTHGSTSVSKNSSSSQIQAAADQAADMVAKAKALNIATFYWMSIIDGTDRTVPQWSLPTVVSAMKSAYYE